MRWRSAAQPSSGGSNRGTASIGWPTRSLGCTPSLTSEARSRDTQLKRISASVSQCQSADKRMRACQRRSRSPNARSTSRAMLPKLDTVGHEARVDRPPVSPLSGGKRLSTRTARNAAPTSPSRKRCANSCSAAAVARDSLDRRRSNCTVAKPSASAAPAATQATAPTRLGHHSGAAASSTSTPIASTGQNNGRASGGPAWRPAGVRRCTRARRDIDASESAIWPSLSAQAWRRTCQG